MSQLVTESIVVPVANQEDTQATAVALEPYDIGDITVLHVVEKGEGVPDKTPVEQCTVNPIRRASDPTIWLYNPHEHLLRESYQSDLAS